MRNALLTAAKIRHDQRAAPGFAACIIGGVISAAGFIVFVICLFSI